MSLSYLGLCWLAARSAVRRSWRVLAAALLITAAATGAGTDPSTGWAALKALLSWTVMPQATLTTRGPLGAALGATAQGLMLLAWLGGWRHLVWQPHWRETERSLPLRPRQLWQADASLLLAVAAPWLLLQAGGWAVLARETSAGGALARLWAGWALSQALALVAAGVFLHRWRQQGSRSAGQGAPLPDSAPERRVAVAIGVWQVLFWGPMRRGAARGLGRAWLGGLLVAPWPAWAASHWPAQRAGAAALGSVLALALVLRLAALARQQLSPLLLLATQQWPLRLAPLLRRLRGLLVLPGLLCVAALSIGVWQAPWRPPVWGAWCVSMLFTQWVLSGEVPADAQWASARVWLMGAVTVALSVEMVS